MDYQIHGSLYHLSGPLEALPGEAPVFAQLYFHGPQAACAQRELSFQDLDRDFLREFNTFL